MMVATDFHNIFFPTMEVNGCRETVTNCFQIIFYVPHKKETNTGL